MSQYLCYILIEYTEDYHHCLIFYHNHHLRLAPCSKFNLDRVNYAYTLTNFMQRFAELKTVECATAIFILIFKGCLYTCTCKIKTSTEGINKNYILFNYISYINYKQENTPMNAFIVMSKENSIFKPQRLTSSSYSKNLML